jgi:hypothetical protein
VLEPECDEARIGEHLDPLLADPQLEAPPRISPGRSGQSTNADGNDAERLDGARAASQGQHPAASMADHALARQK